MDADPEPDEHDHSSCSKIYFQNSLSAFSDKCYSPHHTAISLFYSVTHLVQYLLIKSGIQKLPRSHHQREKAIKQHLDKEYPHLHLIFSSLFQKSLVARYYPQISNMWENSLKDIINSFISEKQEKVRELLENQDIL